MDLFAERGYAETTVAAVAGRAGLTERTFFRHFRDKQEVVFDTDLAGMVAAATAASTATSALDMAADGFRAVCTHLQALEPQVRRRAAVVAARA